MGLARREENLDLPVSDAQRSALYAMLKRDDDVAVLARIILQLSNELRRLSARQMANQLDLDR